MERGEKMVFPAVYTKRRQFDVQTKGIVLNSVFVTNFYRLSSYLVRISLKTKKLAKIRSSLSKFFNPNTDNLGAERGEQETKEFAGD
jgi:hypothetical protein